MSSQLHEISQSLQHRITAKIKQNGAISFADFMHMALYEPGLGYYSAGLHKLGASGDFITSSELGSLFARCHASCFSEVLLTCSKPVVMELGAGTGQFCVDVLTALAELDALPDQYLILEVSGDLQQVQRDKVAQLPTDLAARVDWTSEPPTQPFEGIIYANEVLDALPVEVFRYHQGFERLMLTHEADALTESWQPFPDALQQQLTAKALQLSDGYRSEFIPNLNAWMAAITAPLARGLVLMVDYGFGQSQYYHPQRSAGTLVCHQRHQANFNPYQDVGLQDITAFVDFTAVAEAMDDAGLTVAGFTSQADFLLHNNIQQWVNEDRGYAAYYDLVSEMKKLMLPDEMGEKFKCIAATKNWQGGLTAFQNNRLHEL